MNFHFAMTAEPETIVRLRKLKPGESFVFYRGNTSDLETSPHTPHYSVLLRQVFDCAERLEKDGRIVIDKKRDTIKIECRRRCSEDSYYVTYSLTEFTAIGLEKETAAPGNGLRR